MNQNSGLNSARVQLPLEEKFEILKLKVRLASPSSSCNRSTIHRIGAKSIEDLVPKQPSVIPPRINMPVNPLYSTFNTTTPNKVDSAQQISHRENIQKSSQTEEYKPE